MYLKLEFGCWKMFQYVDSSFIRYQNIHDAQYIEHANADKV